MPSSPQSCPHCGRPPAPPMFQRGDWRISYDPTRVYFRNQPVNLPGRPMAILSTLVREEVASLDLLGAIGIGADAAPKALKAQMWRVRRALDAIVPDLGLVIVSEVGRGYRLDMSEMIELRGWPEE